ncbi:Ankyrin repeat-containing protein [Fusarium oxysporum f. sp. albedinis]|nr:Ankyrin repeat-containing protein [Fusarium oxysporum f. sp. albedinis]
MSKLISRLNQQSEESAERLCKEISCLTEQTSQLNSDIKEKDIQYREVTNELRTRKINFESEFERLSEKLPVLEIEQLKKQIHELHEQIRLLGPELKDKNQDLGTLKKDVSDIKAKTMTREGDIIRESLPSDLRNIMSKLVEMEKAMTQQQIACDERRNVSYFTSTRNTQLDDSNSFSKLQSQVIDLNRNIAQLCEKDRFMVEVQKLQSSATERDSKFSGLKDKMDWLVQEVGKLQRRMKDSEAEVHSRQGDMAEFLRLSSNAWINQKPAEEATSKPNRNQDRRDELDGLREELSQIEKNIMYFTSTFPPPSGQPFSAVLEERFLGKVPVTERLKLLIERVRHRIDDLQSSLAQAKLDDGRVIRPEKARSTFVPDTNEVVTPLSELNMEFLTPTDRESGAIPTPNGQRQSRSADGKHNADSTHGGDLPLSSPVSGLRPCVKSAFTQTGIQEASKTLAVEGHEVLHESADNPMGSRKLEEEHALGSDSVRTDLERLRASLIFHLCTMLFASKRTVDVERLREGSRIFSRRTIGKGNLELLEQVIKGYSEKSMKSRGANKELRKITYKGRKAFPDTLLKTYTTIFKTLLTLTQNFDINDPIIHSRRTKGLEAARLDKGTKIQRRTGKP